MIRFSINDLRETSDADLEAAMQVFQRELERRQEEKRKELIINFHTAWDNLTKTGIEIYYDDKYIHEDDGEVLLEDWDRFSFD